MASAKAARGEDDPLAAAALFRAAEVALFRLEQPKRAATLLERLLQEYPQSQWRALAERSSSAASNSIASLMQMRLRSSWRSPTERRWRSGEA